MSAPDAGGASASATTASTARRSICLFYALGRMQVPLDLLRELVEIESPTRDTRELRDRLAKELRGLGGDVSFAGEHLRADFAGTGGPLLLLGHLDTVWPRGTLERLPWRVEDGRAYGP